MFVFFVFRTFSEGGNFSRDEIETYRKNLKKQHIKWIKPKQLYDTN